MNLAEERQKYQPQLPKALQNLASFSFEKGEATSSLKDPKKLKELFKHTFGQPYLKSGTKHPVDKCALKIGVVFSGGQASGGHNVIIGLFDALTKLDPQSELIGFLGGPSGIIDCKTKILKKEELDSFRNQGGFDLIGSGRTKIETDEQFENALETAKKLQLDGLVIIGGDDSNTNAALLAEHFIEKGCQTKVIGVPKTIDGDLKSDLIETSFGFDTATKTYSEMIGNIERDALSAKKYYHFIKLMGRSASHIALECALQTHPNCALIGEEKQTLETITTELTDLIIKRAEMKKNYGVILIPEGLIEFIPEMKTLIQELNALLAHKESMTPDEATKTLKDEAQKTFTYLPQKIQEQLLLGRDPHGNVSVSQINTEELLLIKVKEELKKRDFQGKFFAVTHFFGYEGRAGFPSNFDATYCYALGHVATLLIAAGFTGYMSCLRHLKESPDKWEVLGIPITSLMNYETRKGKEVPVIKKALVDLDSKSFQSFKNHRDSWKFEDDYCSPGPVQFAGDPEITDQPTLTLILD